MPCREPTSRDLHRSGRRLPCEPPEGVPAEGKWTWTGNTANGVPGRKCGRFRPPAQAFRGYKLRKECRRRGAARLAGQRPARGGALTLGNMLCLRKETAGGGRNCVRVGDVDCISPLHARETVPGERSPTPQAPALESGSSVSRCRPRQYSRHTPCAVLDRKVVCTQKRKSLESASRLERLRSLKGHNRVPVGTKYALWWAVSYPVRAARRRRPEPAEASGGNEVCR